MLKQNIFLLLFPVFAFAAEIFPQERIQCLDITPSARGCPCSEQGLFFSVDFLYWQAKTDNLVYATLKKIDLSGFPAVGITIFEEHLEQPFEWAPGFRASIGYNLPYDAWDLKFSETYYHSHPSDLNVSDPNQFIFANLISTDFSLAGAQNDQVGMVRGSWVLNFNAIDQELGRTFYLNKSLIFRPFGGVKAAWVHQKVKVRYRDILINVSLPAPLNIDAKNNFFGVGPRIGLDTQFLFPKYIGLFFNSSLAFLYGEFDLRTINSNFVGGAAPPQFEDLQYSRYRVTPVTQIQLGLNMSWCFGKNRNLAFQAGYEGQFWWNQMQMNFNIFSTALTAPQDLFMHGLFLNGRLDF